MNRTIHRSLVLRLTTLAALLFFTASAPAADEPATAPSIRHAGHVRPVDLPALAKVPGSVIKAELELEDGRVMYSFEIVTANRLITEVEIDAGNGAVLAVEEE